MTDIKVSDVVAWQNKLLNMADENGTRYSLVYLKTVHNQLSAIFNHAVRFYDLPTNPAAKAGNMGKEKTREMLYWTKDEYIKFSEEIMDKPVSFYVFYSWVFGFGGKVKIKGPENVKEKYSEMLRAAVTGLE